MMMTAAPTNLLQSPKLSSAMNSLSVKRPSLSPLKRKHSDDDETTSPTSADEVPDESVISPKKKAKVTAENSSSTTWNCALALEDDATDGSDEACAKVLAAYTPIAFDAEPAAPLDEKELEILEYFLS